jgi:hypothetical protein
MRKLGVVVLAPAFAPVVPGDLGTAVAAYVEALSSLGVNASVVLRLPERSVDPTDFGFARVLTPLAIPTPTREIPAVEYSGKTASGRVDVLMLVSVRPNPRLTQKNESWTGRLRRIR